jgi:hypothetical protein
MDGRSLGAGPCRSFPDLAIRINSIEIIDFNLDVILCSWKNLNSDAWVDNQVGMAVKGLRSGEVRVIIHDYVIVHIERLEKQRLR